MTCSRCGAECRSEDKSTFKWFSIFKYKHLKFPEIQRRAYKSADLCPVCYSALRAFMNMQDDTEYYVNEIHEKDVQIKSLERRLNDSFKHADMWKKEYEKVSRSFNNCEAFCPKNWKEYREWWEEKHKDDIQ